MSPKTTPEIKNIYTNGPDILPLTVALRACAGILSTHFQRASHGLAEIDLNAVTELTDALITARRNLHFALSGGTVFKWSQTVKKHETKPMPYAIERELRWVLFRADCVSIDLLKTLRLGFDSENIMSYARQLDQFVDEIRAATKKIKKNIKKNALDAGPITQNQTESAESVSTSDEIQKRIEVLERRYRSVKGSVEMLTVFSCPNLKSALCMIEDAELLLDAAEQLHTAMTAMEGKTMNLQVNPRRSVSMTEIIKQQNQERGLAPLPLESALLLKRVKDGGQSGQFLADAFISAYRTDTPFPHSLGGLIRLDAEGFRIFHQVLHIRHISGWNDNDLYQIEQQIEAILEDERQLQAASVEGN